MGFLVKAAVPYNADLLLNVEMMEMMVKNC